LDGCTKRTCASRGAELATDANQAYAYSRGNADTRRQCQRLNGRSERRLARGVGLAE
jgi:hypothetical protein